MRNSFINKASTVMLLLIAVQLLQFHQVTAQVTVAAGTPPHEIKWLSVSALRSWFSNVGAEGEYFRRDRAVYVGQDQIDGLCWPNEYNARMKGVKCAKAMWVGTTNYNDPVANKVFPYKVISIGPRVAFSGTQVIPEEFSLAGKFSHPLVYVDGVSSSARDFDDDLDKEEGLSFKPDRMIVNTFHTSIGLTVTRKVLAFAQQYHDNYYIYEYTLKNTGIVGLNGKKRPDQTLTGVTLFLQHRYAFPGESYSGRGFGDWFPAGASYGRNTINDAVGQDESHTLPAPNDFQAVFSYWGPFSPTPYGGVEGDIGLPGPSATNVQLLAGTQFAGVAVLHIDKGPNDKSHDKTKYITTQFMASDATPHNYFSNEYDAAQMQQKYEAMIAGHSSQTHAEQVGKDANGWPNAFANTWGTSLPGAAGGFSAAQGFGTYTLAAGESVQIVVAEAVAGISREKMYEVARNWFTNNTSQFVLPSGYKGGGTTTDRNEYKNAWVFSGKDSLFQTFRRAIANYNSNYGIPQPPPPPDKFEVTSGGDRIRLSWSNSAESWPNFDGYRIYRAEGKTDTTFEMIWEGKGNSYDDKNAKRGFNYYYYIQTKDDGSTNDIQPGVPLVSSKYYTMTSNPAFLTRPAGLTLTTVKTFNNLQLFGKVTLDGNNGDTIRSIDYYGIKLPKSLLDSIGTVVRGVRVHLNGNLVLPSTFTVINDTIRFKGLPGLNISIALPNRTDTVRQILDTMLAQFQRSNTIEVMVISPVRKKDSIIVIGDGVTKNFNLPEPISDNKGIARYDVTVLNTSGAAISPSLYTVVADTLIFNQAPAISDTFSIELRSVRQRNYKLSEIRIVPNPFNIRAREMQFGTADPTTRDRIAFYNLPPVCKIRIYTETGDLIETINHTNGSGDEYWNSLTSSKQLVVSGLYIAHIEVTEDYRDDETQELLYKKGETVYKKFIIIR